MFNLTWDAELLQQLDDLECSNGERQELRKVEEALKAVQQSVLSKAEEIAKWRGNVESLKKQ
eukprot:6913110-Pyramimonas_sp.AAC.1